MYCASCGLKYKVNISVGMLFYFNVDLFPQNKTGHSNSQWICDKYIPTLFAFNARLYYYRASLLIFKRPFLLSKVFYGFKNGF